MIKALVAVTAWK